MMLTQLAFHVINLLMFVLAIAGYSRALRFVWRSRVTAFTKEYMIKESIAGIAAASVFIMMQVDWIIQSHNQAVGDLTSWGWLMFDYALAMFLVWNSDRIRAFCTESAVRCPYIESGR